jgi:hypothetical protein
MDDEEEKGLESEVVIPEELGYPEDEEGFPDLTLDEQLDIFDPDKDL